MNITLSSLLVDDQEKALKFYTDVLGFELKTDLPAGDFRWLTVVAPGAANGVELVLEPTAFPPARTYQQALREAGIPLTSFAVKDVQSEFERLQNLGVVFTLEPMPSGETILAIFNDTCGNLIQLHQA